MLTVQEGTEIARRYLADSFPDFVANDLRLEEIESPLHAGVWTFTFSSAVHGETSQNSLLQALRMGRRYKLVQVEKDSGFLVAVKNKAA